MKSSYQVLAELPGKYLTNALSVFERARQKGHKRLFICPLSLSDEAEPKRDIQTRDPIEEFDPTKAYWIGEYAVASFKQRLQHLDGRGLTEEIKI